MIHQKEQDMRLTLAVLMAGLAGLVGCSGAAQSNSALLAELETLPVGLEVIHSPSQVRSPVGSGGTGWPYRWI